MMRVILLVLAVMMVMSGLPSHAQDEETPSWCVSVWYPSSGEATGYDSVVNNLDVIDEVTPFWYAPTLEGGFNLLDGAEDTEKLAAWRAAGVQVVPTIVTFGASGMIEDPTIRALHIQNIVDLVEQWDYDGIDIDYESFKLDTRDAFSTFIEDLAVALHANNRLLSMAVHAKTDDAGAWEGAAAQDWERLAPAVDIFRIMTYDYHNRAGEPGTIGPPEWSLAVIRYAASIVDPSKLRLGLHFYGYSWQRSTTVNVITWASVQRWVESFDLEVVRDPSDMEMMVLLDQRGLPKQTIYVADGVGLEYKLDYILDAYPTLGGVSIWGLGGEDPANWDVLRTYTQPCR